MSLIEAFLRWLGHIIEWSTAILFDHVGNIFNYAAILVIFIGGIYWLRTQHRLVKEETMDPK